MKSPTPLKVWSFLTYDASKSHNGDRLRGLKASTLITQPWQPPGQTFKSCWRWNFSRLQNGVSTPRALNPSICLHLPKTRVLYPLCSLKIKRECNGLSSLGLWRWSAWYRLTRIPSKKDCIISQRHHTIIIRMVILTSTYMYNVLFDAEK